VAADGKSRITVPTGSAVGLDELDARSREIFKRIIESYLETGEPVGSRNLSRLLPMPLSPASVRNVMADLEHLGLIYSPHTSAGRLPTDLGLRFFIDALLEVGDLGREERARIEAEVAASGRDNSLDSLLSDAGQLLSGLSRGASVVLSHKSDMRLKHIEFVRLEPTKALVVLVGEDGTVENRLIAISAGLPQSALTEAGNYLNSHIRGLTLSEAQTALEQRKADAQAELDLLSQKVVEEGLASWAGADADVPGRLIVRGRANLLENLTALDELERVRHLLDDLETKQELIRLLGLAEKGDGVRIFIGSENTLFSLSGSSVIVAPYRDSEQRIVGALGVIGPTRLNYGRIIPMVDFTAKVIGRLLG